MKDFLGREIAVGDQIVYCTRQCSSMDLIHARVIELREDGSIRAQPLNAERGKFYWVDSRTGEDIPRDQIDTPEHTLRQAGHYHRETGERIDSNEYYRMPYHDPRKVQYKYQNRVLKDYVTTRRDPSNPVILRTPYYIAKLEPFVEQDTFIFVERQ